MDYLLREYRSIVEGFVTPLVLFLCPASLACSVILYVRRRQRMRGFIQTYATITNYSDTRKRTITVSFSDESTVPAGPDLVIIESFCERPPINAEIRIGRLQAACFRSRGEVAIMYAPGQPELAQLRNSGLMAPRMCLVTTGVTFVLTWLLMGTYH